MVLHHESGPILPQYPLDWRISPVPADKFGINCRPPLHNFGPDPLQKGATQMSDTFHNIAVFVGDRAGFAPSASINPTGKHPALCEPVHGPAPEIAGEAIAAILFT